MPKSLRERLIRLAWETPPLREKVLPLLKRASPESRIRSTIAPIVEETAFSAQIEAEPDNIRIVFKSPTGKLKGYFRASTVSIKSFEWENSPDECKQEWERRGKPTLWVIQGAEWFDPRLKKRGFAKLVYRALLDAIEASGGVLGPGKCAGSTSPDAKGLWKSIYRDLPNHKAVFRVRLGYGHG